MNKEFSEGARPLTSHRSHHSAMIDSLHERNLLRLLQLANEYTVRELGPAPTNAAPLQKKRKPDVRCRDFLGRELELRIREDDEMKPKQLVAGALMTAGLIAGCADPNHPALNPHPKQRYEITLTIHDAPGPFESVTGFLSYDIENASDCAPQDWISGTHPTPSYYPPVTLHRVSDTVFQGSVYLDTPQDENYYEKGTCHWKFSGLSILLKNKGSKFAAYLLPQDISDKNTVTVYTLKSIYYGAQVKDIPGMNFHELSVPISNEVIANRDKYFSITLSAADGTLD